MPWAKLQRACERNGSPAREEERLPGPLLEALGQQVPSQSPARGEPVAVRVGEGGGAVGVQDAADHPATAGSGQGGVEHVAHVEQHVLDQGGFEGGLVVDVLVERRCPHPEVVGEPAHRQRLGAFVVEDREGGPDEVLASRAERIDPGGRAVGSIGSIEAEHGVLRGDPEQRLVGRRRHRRRRRTGPTSNFQRAR